MKLSLVEVLQSINDGGALEDLRDELAVAVKNVQLHQSPAKVTLELSIEPNGEKAVFITDKVSSKLPVKKNAKSAFFVCDDASLSRKDPSQFEMFDRQAQ